MTPSFVLFLLKYAPGDAPRVFPVTDTVTCVRRRRISRVVHRTIEPQGRVEGRRPPVDAGMKSDGSDVLHALETLGLDASSVRAIFLTHWHNDHAAGAGRWRRARGARRVLAAEAPYLRRGDRDLRCPRLDLGHGAGGRPVRARERPARLRAHARGRADRHREGRRLALRARGDRHSGPYRRSRRVLSRGGGHALRRATRSRSSTRSRAPVRRAR